MILHIANDFSGSRVYNRLIGKLSTQIDRQIVYTAIRSKDLIGKNDLHGVHNNIKVYYRYILSNYLRINFYAKVKTIEKDIYHYLDFKDIDLVHAHTWYSDGAIALSILKKHAIPYVITIRNTDINVFLKYMIHLRKIGLEILQNAQKVIFISEAHKRRIFNNKKLLSIIPDLEKKSFVIPNGVDSYWLNNLYDQKRHINKPITIIYVGKFDKGKNVESLIKATKYINCKSGSNIIKLRLVGGGGNKEKNIQNIISKNRDFIEFTPQVTEKEVLKKLYRTSDIFAMPSLAETFGLVYIEALSQGLPVIYSKGEGIDGYLDKEFGIACNPKSIRSIISALEYSIANYQLFNIDKDFLFNNFNWDKIANKYVNSIYNY